MRRSPAQAIKRSLLWPEPRPALYKLADAPDRVRGEGREALQQAGIEETRDVHYVQVKCPLLTSQKIREAKAAGHSLATTDTYKSMGYSRGASALGVALALGEIEPELARDETVLERMDWFSAVASASAGSELDHCE